jgi:hypothetical protein
MRTSPTIEHFFATCFFCWTCRKIGRLKLLQGHRARLAYWNQSNKRRLLNRLPLELLLEYSKYLARRKLNEELWQSANALEKMITLIQTTEAYKVAAQVRNEKKTDKQ